MKILEADQNLPYNLMKNKLLNRKQYKEILNIILKNMPDAKPNEIIKILENLKHEGCSCAMFANTLGNHILSLNMDENTFISKFGFSPYIPGTKVYDYNKLMVDVYTKLYNLALVKHIDYEKYYYKNPIDAVKDLFLKNITNDNDAILYLFENGILADGYSNNMLRYKNTIPSIKRYIGNSKSLSKRILNKEIDSFDEIKKTAKENNISLEISDEKIYEKLTGLTPNKFNFWSKYYSRLTNLNFYLEKENSQHYSLSDLMYNIDTEKEQITVGIKNNSEVYMHTNNLLSWIKPSSKEAGHVMLFKKLNSNNDIIVSSYGKDYIIPKEYIEQLEFSKIKAVSKIKVNQNKMNIINQSFK